MNPLFKAERHFRLATEKAFNEIYAQANLDTILDQGSRIYGSIGISTVKMMKDEFAITRYPADLRTVMNKQG